MKKVKRRNFTQRRKKKKKEKRWKRPLANHHRNKGGEKASDVWSTSTRNFSSYCFFGHPFALKEEEKKLPGTLSSSTLSQSFTSHLISSFSATWLTETISFLFLYITFPLPKNVKSTTACGCSKPTGKKKASLKNLSDPKKVTLEQRVPGISLSLLSLFSPLSRLPEKREKICIRWASGRWKQTSLLPRMQNDCGFESNKCYSTCATELAETLSIFNSESI